MAKSRPRVPDIRRRRATQSPKVTLVIAFEGKNTEPDYVRRCCDEYGNGNVRLVVLEKRGSPGTVVRIALAEREILIERARKSPDSFDSCFRVWAVFDRDEHEDFEEAIELARANHIDCAFSNPCFELWPLLHIRDHNAPIHRHDLQRLLGRLMPGYDHDAGAIVDFEQIRNEVDVAIERAERCYSNRESEGDPCGNPSTTVHRLVTIIRKNGKKPPSVG